jgi:hypothetical protein
MDGYSCHEQKKQDLQASKTEGLVHAKGARLIRDGSKGGVLTGNRHRYVYTSVHKYLSHIRYLQLTLLCV